MATGNRSDWLVVAISGVTCGGKTTLAKKLKQYLPQAIVVHQDTYFYKDDDPNHVKVPNMEHNNYDVLSSLDMEKMLEDVKNIIRGNPDSLCIGKTQRKILVLEGFTILNYEPIAKLCDLKYHIDLSKEECSRRRSLRVYDPPDVPGYFEFCAWPEYCRYFDELKADTSVTLFDGTDHSICERVLPDIKAFL